MMCTERRDIGTDQHGRSRRAVGEGAMHPFAEIAPALPDDRDAARPETPAMTGAVRRDGDAQTPSSVSNKAAQQPPQHQPLETQRRDVADVARQAALAAAERRRTREYDHMARHQP